MNKSLDLQKYVTKYYEFCKQLAAMIAALKAHYSSMVKYEETQTQVRKNNNNNNDTRKHPTNQTLTCLLTQISFCSLAPRTVFRSDELTDERTHRRTVPASLG
jgi:hypothetical protein